MKQLTIFGYRNTRFFVNNPRGAEVWFNTRRDRDVALAKVCASARSAGLSDPSDFPAIEKRLRSQAALDWLLRLAAREVLRANGIDGPQDQPDQLWGPALDKDEAKK